MNSIFKHQLIMFIIMVVLGMAFNAMNVLAYRLNDLYVSLTLFYGGLLMASNMMWGMEIVHYLDHGHFNGFVFCIGILLSVFISLYLLRKQFLVDDEQWLKRMISHHSTAITTSQKIYNKTQNKEIKKLSKSIIYTQEKEIQLMKSLLK